MVKIEEPENMPVDAAGVRADVIMDPNSVISRMNLGRAYEHYFNGAVITVGRNLRNMLGLQKGQASQELLSTMNQELVAKAYTYLLDFYKIVTDAQYMFYSIGISDAEKMEHLANCINDEPRLYYPPSNPKKIVDTVKQLEIYYPQVYGPVTYTGNSGNKVTTHRKVRIAPLYLMLLEKIADDWSAVSSGKLQHFGVLSPMTKSEKFAYPYRNSPVRTIGETEGRIFLGYCGVETIAEMMDRSNNPATQRNIVHNILHANKPSAIPMAIDRNYIELGGAKTLSLIRHSMQAAGFDTVFEPEDLV